MPGPVILGYPGLLLLYGAGLSAGILNRRCQNGSIVPKSSGFYRPSVCGPPSGFSAFRLFFIIENDAERIVVVWVKKCLLCFVSWSSR